MPSLSFGGKTYTVNHAVKGPDYVHGYNADGTLLIAFDGVSDFSGFSYNGKYMDPTECATEGCNGTILVGGALKTKDGRSVTPAHIGAVPTVRTINGYPLTEDVVIKAEDLGAAGNEGLTEHINDKNNPHNVTTEQIGAAPASHIEDKNNPHGVTAEQIGAVTCHQVVTGDIITMNDSGDLPLHGLKLYGKTTQLTTTGKNLYDLNAANVINECYIDSKALTQNKYTTTVYIPCTPNTAYTVSKFKGSRLSVAYCTELPKVGVSIYGLIVNHTATSVTITTGNDAKYLVSYVYCNAPGDDTISWDEAKKTIQIEVGSVATEYEPYTNGKASPSPDYPQEQESVGASGEIVVTIAGDNLYYGKNLSFTRYKNYKPTMPLPPGTYTLSALVTSTDTDSTTSAATFLDENDTNIGSVSLSRDVRSSGTVTINKYCYGIRFAASNNYNNSAGDTATWTDIMLNRGDVALPYKPHNKQTLLVNTPNGLPGIDSFADEIDFARGVRVQRVYEYVVTGDETIGTGGNTARVLLPDSVKYPHKSKLPMLCNRFTQHQASFNNVDAADTTMADGGFAHYYRRDNETRAIYFKFNEPTDIDTATAWFKANETRVLIPLETPIETPLSAEELAAYAALHSNKPNTTIYNDGVVEMEVSYYTPNAAVPMNLGTGASGKVLSVDEHGCVVPKTLEQIGSAPAGYGLGKPSTEIRNCDLDDIVENGWYSYNMGAEVANVPMDIASMLFVENFYDTNFCKHTITFLDGINTTVTRVRQSGSWGEWEYKNPPMTPGVEYRTTERYNGKAVYTKLIDMGTYTSGVMRVAHNCGDITPIRCFGVQGNITIPMHQCDSEDGREYDWIVGLRADQTSVEVSSHTESPNGVNVKAQIWYVKN